MSSDKHISNLSYTNKDFNSIYVELLEYAKKLSYRWDPSASDESDPGVVLLKLASIIGDKNNYNIDKNVLELMPVSVTQPYCARQLFSQCGYNMRYYESATGFVNLTVKSHIGNEDEINPNYDYTYKVPMFTMFTDTTTSVVYTTTREMILPYKQEVAIPVIEGTLCKYTVNNDDLITVLNLDSTNRLYFTESNIAQNGIFITNYSSVNPDATNYEEWYLTDNLEIQPTRSRCYKFGLTNDGMSCYIEFPDDIEFLFNEGIKISYVTTSGKTGNIAARMLSEFYTTTQFVRTAVNVIEDPVKVDATTDNVSIKNILPISNGKDPESIDEAYKSYNRIKTTFDTLVSLKDYNDYLVTSESASNGFVCDRTNDIQHSYKIKQNLADTYMLKLVTENKEDNSATLSAFDLCVYALNYEPIVSSYQEYKSTFTLTEGNTFKKTLSEEKIKSLQHDFVPFEENRILLLKNKFPIHCTIVPRKELTYSELSEILSNIEHALYDKLNSKEVIFGEGVSFDLLESTILNADSRIKHIEGLITPNYETYAVYKPSDNPEFAEMRIDSLSHSAGYEETSINMSTDTYSEIYKFTDNKFVQLEESEFNSLDPAKKYYKFNADKHKLWKSFRAEIFSKNVLCGTTSLYNSENDFNYGLTQKVSTELFDVVSFYSNLDLKLSITQDSLDSINAAPNTNIVATYESPVLRENENVLLTSPNFIEDTPYSTYVKVIYNLGKSSEEYITGKGKHELKNDEFIVFFWKASDSDVNYTYMKYDANTDINIISPSFNLPKKMTSTKIWGEKGTDSTIIEYFKKLKSGKHETNGSVIQPSLGNVTETTFVKSLNSTANYEVLSGTNVITTYKINKININNTTNGCNLFYWILNVRDESNNYVLFKEKELKRTLRSGEYLFYTDSAKSTLYMLGEGTVIERGTGYSSKIWEVPAIKYSEIIASGIDILSDKWFKIDLTDDPTKTLSAIEMLRQLIGAGNKFILKEKVPSTEHVEGIYLTSTSEEDLGKYDISYQDSTNTTHKIDSISVNGSGWQATTILNLNMSKESPQKLEDGQSTTFKIKGDAEFIYKSGTYLQSNIPLSVVGGGEYLLLDTASGTSINILPYTLSESAETSNNFTGRFEIQCPGKETVSQTITFRLPKGTYLCKVDSTDTLNIVTENVEFEPLFDDTFSIYKLTVSSGPQTDTTITLKYKNESSEHKIVTVIFNQLYKYNSENLAEIVTDTGTPNKPVQTFEDDVIEKLSHFDSAHEFDYSSPVDSTVANPLDSSSFFNYNHFYNKFTIPQWNIKSDTDIANTVQIVKGIR